jgi:cardiolipin synthase
MILVLMIYGSHRTASIRMTWIILILVLPIVGTVLYFLIGLNGYTIQMRKRYVRLDKKLFPLLPENEDVFRRASARSGRLTGVMQYIRKMRDTRSMKIQG